MKQNYNYDENMLFLLSKAHWGMHKILHKHFKESNTNVTPDQWLILLNLYNTGAMYQSELSRTQFKDRAAIKRLVDQLQEKGLIKKNRIHQDLRKKRVELTEKGESVVVALNVISKKTFKESLKDLSEVEINALKRLIQRLN